jgi:hypothetical protein
MKGVLLNLQYNSRFLSTKRKEKSTINNLQPLEELVNLEAVHQDTTDLRLKHISLSCVFVKGG